MKHVTIYQDVLNKELAVAKQQMEGSRSASGTSAEWASICGSLLYPEEHPRDAYQHLRDADLCSPRITYDMYLDGLRSCILDTEEKRHYILGVVKQGASYLQRALDGDTEAIREYAAFTENLEPRDRYSRKPFFVGKCMVVYLLMIHPDFKDRTYYPIVHIFGARYCDRLLRSIRDGLLQEYGMKRQRRTARDVLQKTEEALHESSAAAAGISACSDLEQLRFMNNNYKNSLEMVQAMLDELNETIDETAAEAKNAAIASFYSDMNSAAYGNLLDSIELVERRLAALKENQVKTPPQFMPLTIVFKQLSRFIHDCGITQIDTTGREFTSEVEGLAEYIYIGEAYSYDGEKKTVIVERPGWKYGSTVISLPTVREKE